MFTSQELAEYFEGNDQTFMFLSHVFFKELSEEAIEQLSVATYPEDSGNESLDQGYKMINRYFTFCGSDRRTELACEYARIFLAAGLYTKARDVAVPYESVFTSEEQLVMQESRDDVYRRYLADGFTVDPALHEPEDHIAFELEYLGNMSKRACELSSAQDTDALRTNISRQIEFIDEHLLNWLPRLRATAQRYAQLTFYIGIMLVAEGYLQECKDNLQAILGALASCKDSIPV